MTESPIDKLLGAVDRLDVDAVMALTAPECRVLTADGRRAEGAPAVRELMSEFLGALRAVTYAVTGQWNQGDVWIAEVDATYELKDWAKLGILPRAFVLREGPSGFVELHVYGAHERPLSDYRTGEQGLRVGGRWIPPL